MRQATEDALTGLLNRRGAELALHRALAQAARDGRPCCVALLDVDEFKRVNDTGGHLAGDGLLAALGQSIRVGLRSTDWAARLGGDEFLLVLEADLGEAVPVVERLRVSAAAQRVGTGEQAVSATLSVGLTAVLPGDDRISCLHRADEALYRAKHTGRNRVVVTPAAESDGPPDAHARP